MKKIACAAALVLACAPVLVVAEDVKPDFKTADMKTWKVEKPKEKKERPAAKDKSEEKKEKDKEPEKKKLPPMWTPWDIAFGAALMTDYNFRGITQTNHNLSVAAYVEPRLNFNNSLQGYLGLSGESIAFTDHAPGEIDFYGGIRPNFGNLGFDFGVWQYWYPGGECFHDFIRGCLPSLPNGNVTKADVSFWELYGKAFYAVNNQFLLGGGAYWSPSVFDSGAKGTFVAGMAKYILPTVLPYDIGWFISADVGHWFLGTSDSFYAVPGFPGGVPYKSYTTWDVGLAFMWKQFTFDLRYYDTNLNRGDCNAFTHDFTASGVASTLINPGGPGSNRCGASFIAKFSFDLTHDYLKSKEAQEAKKPEMKMPDVKMPETKWPKEEKGKSEEKKGKSEAKKKEKPEAKKSGEEKPEGKKEKSDKKESKAKTPAEFDYGASLMTEFNIRGISASDHEPSVATHFEPRYNLRDNLQAYGRVEVNSIFLANRAEASVNLYAGIRPTFGNLTVDYGWWQRVFPGEVCVLTRANPGVCLIPPHLDYGELFAKPIYKVDKQLSLGGGVFWSPSVLNSGDPATYVQGLAKYVLPTLRIGSRSIGSFLFGDVGHWFREGTPYVSYTNWNIGLTFTSKPYALELRYSDTDKVDCDVARTPISLAVNPGGPLSNRCRGVFIARFSVDLDGGYSKPE